MAGITAAHGKTHQTVGANSHGFTNCLDHSVGFIAGIFWTKSQKSPIFARGGGGVVTNDWCII